jgi:hypothetical protein
MWLAVFPTRKRSVRGMDLAQDSRLCAGLFVFQRGKLGLTPLSLHSESQEVKTVVARDKEAQSI